MALALSAVLCVQCVMILCFIYPICCVLYCL